MELELNKNKITCNGKDGLYFYDNGTNWCLINYVDVNEHNKRWI